MDYNSAYLFYLTWGYWPAFYQQAVYFPYQGYGYGWGDHDHDWDHHYPW
jgi:hypothetical protein